MSIADQIFIKAWRIRQIQEMPEGQGPKIADSIESEFAGIVNYGIMALIQLKLEGEKAPLDLPTDQAADLFDEQAHIVRALMEQKNHDYGEAWRSMSQVSFVDLILSKILRIRQILMNKGKTWVSEGIDANFQDIVNYALFALIQSGHASPKGH